MKLAELMKLQPEQLAKVQEEHLQKAAVDRLITIANLIKNRAYTEAEKFLSSSPAGDDHGCNNQFITFQDIFPVEGKYADEADLGTVLDKLTQLRTMQGVMETKIKEKK